MNEYKRFFYKKSMSKVVLISRNLYIITCLLGHSYNCQEFTCTGEVLLATPLADNLTHGWLWYYFAQAWLPSEGRDPVSGDITALWSEEISNHIRGNFQSYSGRTATRCMPLQSAHFHHQGQICTSPFKTLTGRYSKKLVTQNFLNTDTCNNN